MIAYDFGRPGQVRPYLRGERGGCSLVLRFMKLSQCPFAKSTGFTSEKLTFEVCSV